MVATSDSIAEQLRQAILRGEFKSEDPLPQDKLANDMGVSKVPLREALAELKSEGLVIYKANRGAFVTSLSSRDAQELYLMRIALEKLVLERAIPHLTKVDLTRARSALLMIDAEDNPQMWAQLNWDFHSALYRPANMPHLMSMLRILHTNVGRYLMLYLDKLSFQQKSQAEHYALLDACAAGDTSTALSILLQHLEDASLSMQTYLDSTQDEAR